MWLWVLIAAAFLYLMSWSLSDGLSNTASRPLALLGSLTDAAAMICMGAGVFGLMMALVLGVFAGGGLRLSGASLTNTLIWSVGLIVAAFAFVVLGTALRRMGGRAEMVARPTRGGH
jgi:uncharacterized protein YacL